VLPNETNIVIFELNENIDAPAFMGKMEKHGLLAVSFGGQLIRLVTHLDFDDDQLDKAAEILQKL
jgi:threonine aldolase